MKVGLKLFRGKGAADVAASKGKVATKGGASVAAGNGPVFVTPSAGPGVESDPNRACLDTGQPNRAKPHGLLGEVKAAFTKFASFAGRVRDLAYVTLHAARVFVDTHVHVKKPAMVEVAGGTNVVITLVSKHESDADIHGGTQISAFTEAFRRLTTVALSGATVVSASVGTVRTIESAEVAGGTMLSVTVAVTSDTSASTSGSTVVTATTVKQVPLTDTALVPIVDDWGSQLSDLVLQKAVPVATTGASNLSISFQPQLILNAEQYLTDSDGNLFLDPFGNPFIVGYGAISSDGSTQVVINPLAADKPIASVATSGGTALAVSLVATRNLSVNVAGGSSIGVAESASVPAIVSTDGGTAITAILAKSIPLAPAFIGGTNVSASTVASAVTSVSTAGATDITASIAANVPVAVAVSGGTSVSITTVIAASVSATARLAVEHADALIKRLNQSIDSTEWTFRRT